MMSFTSALLPPILLFLSIPFIALAVFTSAIAFSTLFLRALLLYIDLAVVILHNYFFHGSPNHPSTIPPSYTALRRTSSRPESSGKLTSRQYQRRSTTSASPARRHSKQSQRRLSTPNNSFGSLTPTFPPDSGSTPHADVSMTRDFEGVGGWRLTGPTEEDKIWTSMNSRLELPAAPERKRRHRRSRTSGSEPGSLIPISPMIPSSSSFVTTGDARRRSRDATEAALSGTTMAADDGGRSTQPHTPTPSSGRDALATSPQDYFPSQRRRQQHQQQQQQQEREREREREEDGAVATVEKDSPPPFLNRHTPSSESSTSVVSSSSRGSHLLMKNSSTI
ncbi:MAG: hypothetical protein M1837_006873 [Sclerophora amabilis]|nr:MAG: hypothetical protein M1837_006873 [Sclerophora amabilis]